jgi:hypothetical protein
MAQSTINSAWCEMEVIYIYNAYQSWSNNVNLFLDTRE